MGREASAGPRFNFWLLAAFAGIAFVLAVSGVYSMLASTIAERRREVAGRLALGADGATIVRLLFTSGLRLAAMGIGAGTLAALALTRLIASLLYDVTPTDAPTFAAATASLLLAAAVACYLPAKRATRLDPVSILRH